MSAGAPVPQGLGTRPSLALGAAAATSIGLMVAGAMSANTGLTYARARGQAGSRLAAPDAATTMRGVTALQGIAALIAVAALLLSGKVEAHERDWAANVVFIAGGLAVFALSAMAVLAERRTAT
jgi:hypothetical protein